MNENPKDFLKMFAIPLCFMVFDKLDVLLGFSWVAGYTKLSGNLDIVGFFEFAFASGLLLSGFLRRKDWLLNGSIITLLIGVSQL